MIRTFYLLLLLAPIMGFAAGERTLRSGWYPWEPYQHRVSKDGAPALAGLDISLLDAIAEKGGFAISHQAAPWNKQLEDLVAGRQDIAVGFKTPEREKFARFSAAYRFETNVLYVARNKDLPHFDNLDELLEAVRNGFRLGVVADYAYGPDQMRTFLFDPDHEACLVKASDDLENFQNLFAGTIDGFLADQTVAATIAWRMGWQDRVREHRAYRNREPIYVLFGKASTTPDDVAAFDRGLAALRDSGEYQKIVRKYLFPVLLSLTVSQGWFFAIDLIGTIAFALSGLALARRGRYSLFGALVLAALPAVGGGMVRDLLVQRHPLGVFRSPTYMIVILLTVIAGYLFFLVYERRLVHDHRTNQYKDMVKRWAGRVIEVCDALGLAAFTITGVVVAVESGLGPLWLWGPLLAVLTGAGGGILRDVVRADVDNPTLKGNFYAEVALIWGLALSLFLIWESSRLSHTEIFQAVLVVMAGAFVTRMFVAFRNIKSPMFGVGN